MCTVSTHILRLPSRFLSLFSPTAIVENWGRRLGRRLWDLIILSSTMLPVSLATRPITVRSPVFTTIPVQVPACVCMWVYTKIVTNLHMLGKLYWTTQIKCTNGQAPSTALEEKKAMFLLSRGLGLLESFERGCGSHSPVRELLSTWVIQEESEKSKSGSC